MNPVYMSSRGDLQTKMTAAFVKDDEGDASNYHTEFNPNQ